MMSALPLLPQSAPSSTGAGLSSPMGEKAMINFDALLVQSAQASSDAMPVSISTSIAAQPAAAASGSFEDLGVILQLLQASTASQGDPLPEAALTDTELSPGASENPDAPLAKIPAHLPAPDKNGAAVPQSMMPPGSDLPPALVQILGNSTGKTVSERLTLPEMVAELNDRLSKSSDLAQLDLPVIAEGAAPRSDAPHIAGSATVETPPSAVLLQTMAQDAEAPQPFTQHMTAAPILTETSRKAGPPAGSAPLQAAAQNDSDAAPLAPALARMSAALAASPPLPSLTLLPGAAPISLDNGAAMAAIFNQTATAQHAAPIEAATSAASVQEQILDLNSDDGWIDQLARDIAATKSGKGDISFRLMPRHLGRLDVAMIQNDQGISVRMDAQNEITASIVAAGQNRLVEELRQQGVRVASAEVTHSPHDAGRQSQGRDGQGQQPAGHHFIETAPDRLPDAMRSDNGASDPRGRFA